MKYVKLCRKVSTLSGLGGRELVITFHEGRLYMENMPLPVKRQQLQLFKNLLAENGMSGFELDPTLEDRALENVLKGLVSKSKEERERTVLGFRWLTQEEVQSRVEASTRLSTRCHALEGLEGRPFDFDFCDSMLHNIAEFMERSAHKDTASLSLLMAFGDKLVTRVVEKTNGVLSVVTLPYFNDFTYHHTLNVSILTLSAARLVVKSLADLQRICQATLLYDIGKSRIPPEILHKPDRLSQHEAELVMSHPVEGAAMLTGFSRVDPLSVLVALSHHIKDGGHGYPKTSEDFQLNPVAALVEVVDIFEALTSSRPFKKAVTAPHAFEILYSMPNMESFRPYVNLLIQAVGFNPVGSRVRTEDGQIAMVVGHRNNDPLRPVVRSLQKAEDGRFRLGDEISAPATLDAPEPVVGPRIVSLDPEEDKELLGVA